LDIAPCDIEPAEADDPLVMWSPDDIRPLVMWSPDDICPLVIAPPDAEWWDPDWSDIELLLEDCANAAPASEAPGTKAQVTIADRFIIVSSPLKGCSCREPLCPAHGVFPLALGNLGAGDPEIADRRACHIPAYQSYPRSSQ
jgi:hypothetical protein